MSDQTKPGCGHKWNMDVYLQPCIGCLEAEIARLTAEVLRLATELGAAHHDRVAALAEVEAAYGDWMRRAVAAEEAMRGQAAVVMLGGVYDQIRQRADAAERALASEEEISRTFSRSARAFEDRALAAEKALDVAREDEAVAARRALIVEARLVLVEKVVELGERRLALVEPLVGAVEALGDPRQYWGWDEDEAEPWDALHKALAEWKKGTP